MRELEAKLQLGVYDSAKVVSQLEQIGLVFGEPVTQVDSVFAASDEIVRRPKPGTIICRVREAGGEATLTLKQRRSTDLDRTEIETRIDDARAGKEILEALGQRPVLIIRKTRRVAHASSGASIAVDDVDGLGTFVEVEVLADETAQAQATLEDLLERIATSLQHRGERTDIGYDRMLLQ